MDASYIEQWRARSRQLRAEADRLTYAETSSMMRGLADDYLRIADIAEAMAAIRRSLYHAAIEADEAGRTGQSDPEATSS
jgi:hypothetical protein